MPKNDTDRSRYMIEHTCRVFEVTTNEQGRTVLVARQEELRTWTKDAYDDALAYHSKAVDAIDSLGFTNDAQSVIRRAA